MSGALVLCYHALSPDWPAQLSTTQELFERQLRRLARRGWTGTTFSDALATGPRRRVVAVTFDDAFRSVATLAKPVLDSLGWPATVFVPSDFAGAAQLRWAGIDQWVEGPHAHELAPMGWQELAELGDAGWELGSHTCSHPRLTTVGDVQLAHELSESKRACEQQLGRPCRTIAYPYGDVDARVVAATAAAGYDAAAALPSGLRAARSGPRHEYPRVGVYRKDGVTRFRLKIALRR
jgi:peptidoglycan/xylan/chitin deacetylase (PgdA/CDA1 family)